MSPATTSEKAFEREAGLPRPSHEQISMGARLYRVLAELGVTSRAALRESLQAVKDDLRRMRDRGGRAARSAAPGAPFRRGRRHIGQHLRDLHIMVEDTDGFSRWYRGGGADGRPLPPGVDGWRR